MPGLDLWAPVIPHTNGTSTQEVGMKTKTSNYHTDKMSVFTRRHT